MQEIKQTFKFPRILTIAFVIQFLVFILFCYKTNEVNNAWMLTSIFFFLIGAFLFFKFHLKIDDSGIKYSFFPFVKKTIKWNNITNCEINKISALYDFGGWGIRYSIKYGWGYIFCSGDVLTVYKTNGKRITFSIKDKQEIEKWIEKQNTKK